MRYISCQKKLIMKNHLPCVVSIAGTDPSGGAGIQADIKTISATGSYAASVITALVAQNTQGVRSIYSVTPQFVKDQIDAVFEDLEVTAVKIGMLHNKAIMEVVAKAIETFKPKFVVLDPVIVAKDGGLLLELSDLDFLKNRLFPLATLITPNLFEAEKIIQQSVTSRNDMEETAKALAHQFQINVLV